MFSKSKTLSECLNKGENNCYFFIDYASNRNLYSIRLYPHGSEFDKIEEFCKRDETDDIGCVCIRLHDKNGNMKYIRNIAINGYRNYTQNKGVFRYVVIDLQFINQKDDELLMFLLGKNGHYGKLIIDSLPISENTQYIYCTLDI